MSHDVLMFAHKLFIVAPKRFFSIRVLLLYRFMPGIASSGNAWERRSQSYFDSGNSIKPALGELDSTKSAQFAPKFVHLRSKIDNFSGEGAQSPS